MRVSRKQAEQNRKRVLETAGALFREKGFDGVGVADLMKSAGLTHGGFYGQFGSKDNLAAEALRDTLVHAAERWKGRAEAQPDDKFGAIAGYYLSARHRDDPANGCPASALASDVSRHGGEVRAAYTVGLRELIDILAETTTGDTPVQRRQAALAAFSTMVGAVVMARAVDDAAFSDEILVAAKRGLELRRR